MRMLLALLAAFSVMAPPAGARAEEGDLAAYVNPFVGTDGDGNTFPGATAPFGMVQWSPDTNEKGFYKYKDSKIRGFSMTHLSGAGCPVFADIRFTPLTATPKFPVELNAAGFSHERERASPGYYAVELDNGVGVELTATRRTAAAVFRYPRADAGRLLVNAGGSANGNTASSVRFVGDRELVGSATSGGFCDSKTSYTVYFAARFERPFRYTATWADGGGLTEGADSAAGKQAGAYVMFDRAGGPDVRFKVGLSFVSAENARLNLEAETAGRSFEELKARARRVWNSWLNRVRVGGGTPEQRRVFYTALYHSLIAPNVFSDVNGQYVGFDRKVHTARGYTHYANFSDWDTYRTVVQLHALLAPRETSDMMRSLVAAADESGYLPKWPLANDVTAVMGGDNPVPLIATAHAFGARRFDARRALRYMLKAATRPGRGLHDYEERPRLAEYLERGYIPLKTLNWDHGVTGSASATLEYATDDFCIARLALALGDRRTHRAFIRRAQNWQHLFDAEIGFARPRRTTGVFLEGFDPDKVLPHSEAHWDRSSQAGFEEGNTWQYTWMVPHNYEGLIEAVGGREEAVRRLDRFFEKLTGWGTPHFNIANEPSFVAPYVYTFAGRPSRTHEVVHRTLGEIFDSGPSGLPGNDDLGATSAWYVWGALGLYPAIPAVGGFVISTPLFPSATIRLGDGRLLRLIAPGAAAGRHHLRRLTLNGAPYDSAWLPLERIRPGTTTLDFKLSDTPDASWGTAALPPSFTEGQAPALAFIHGPDDAVTLRPGESQTVTLGVRKLTRARLLVKWTAVAPPGLSLDPSAHDIQPGDALTDSARLTVSPHTPAGTYTVPFKFLALSPDDGSRTPMPDVVLEVRVKK